MKHKLSAWEAIGGCTEKVSWLCEAKLPCSDGGVVTLRVCETCLEKGNIDERLTAHIEGLEARARDLRELVGRLAVPTFREWKAAEDALNAEFEEEELKEDSSKSGVSCQRAQATQ